MTSVGERLAQLRQALGHSQEEMSLRLGVAERTYQAYERNESEPKFHVLKALAELGADTAWLITGQRDRRQRLPVQDRQLEIPHFSARFPLGAPSGDHWPVPLTLSADWARRLTGCSPDGLVYGMAAGDDMEPVIGRGDLLLIDVGDRRLVHGRTYAIVVDDTLLTRRVHRRVDGQVVLVTGKTDYPPEILSLDPGGAIRIVGCVRWFGRPLEMRGHL